MVPAPKYQVMEMEPDERIDWKEVTNHDEGMTAMEMVHTATSYPPDVLMPLFRNKSIILQSRHGRTYPVPPGYHLQAGDILGIPKQLPDYLYNRLEGNTRPIRKLSLAETKLVRSWELFRTDECIVINKPPGVACDPSRGSGLTVHDLLPGLMYDYDEMPKMCTKLEKEASGCMVLSRNKAGFNLMSRRLRVARAPSFCFWAAVAKKPKPASGRITMNLDIEKKASGDRVVIRMEESHTTQKSTVEYSVVSESKLGPAWVSFYPLTSRRNEMRIASSMVLKAPILGDYKYGGDVAVPREQLARLLGKGRNDLDLHLHCHQVSLPYEDLGGRRRVITAPLPPHMKALWDFMLWDPNYKDPYLAW
eukprot:TRINITY_DN8284_c0_g1_i4.p1 TRINITY_DN8284_c0_g1~~TRINITY_DN8284_c0_g1_i4.p1  ORF type:complete len:363 (+),score=89.55 TRINITY_DN8284_c0_g1_i4:134-1222(+)